MSKSCPYCASKERNRIKREKIFKRIPRLRSYQCFNCGSHYLFHPLIHRSFLSTEKNFDLPDAPERISLIISAFSL